MKNDIYTMLNRANIDLENCEKEDFTDIEKKNIKNNLRKLMYKKKPHKRNMLVAAAVIAILTIGIFGTNSGASALSRVLVLPGVKDIAGFLGIEKDLDEYKTVVNKSITDNGITVQLNEVILDGNEMTVSNNITSDRKLEKNESLHAFIDIYVNGKQLSTGGGGGGKRIDDYTTQEVIAYDLKNADLSGDLKIEISCSSILLNDKEKRGSWDFEFKTNGDALKIDTKEMLLNNKFTLENGQNFTLQKYADNALGQKIYASISNFQKKSVYDVSLKGSDDLGNKVEFYASSSGQDGALFKIETINGNLNKDARTLNLTPYAAKYPDKSGKMDGEYKQVGDEFTIDLTQLR